MEDWSDLAVPGTVIAVRVTPGARTARVEREGPALRVRVTVPPEGGRANAAVIAAVAQAIGVAKTRLTIVRGATSRDKVVRVD